MLGFCPLGLCSKVAHRLEKMDVHTEPVISVVWAPAEPLMSESGFKQEALVISWGVWRDPGQDPCLLTRPSHLTNWLHVTQPRPVASSLPHL